MTSEVTSSAKTGPRYFDPDPLPNQWDVPIPGLDGVKLREKELWRQIYFYFKASSVMICFLITTFVTVQTQLLVAPVYLIDKLKYRKILHYTQKLFGCAMVSLHQLFAPTTFVLYKDPSIEGSLLARPDLAPGQRVSLDDLKPGLSLPERLILISNHQLYSDWIYIWCLAYFCRRHGDLKIILKKSLAKIPIWGWGMWHFDFIFLERNWLKDAKNFLAHMNKFKASMEPLWLLIFPEGTTLSAVTREKSHTFAESKGIAIYKHTLLPRSLGLFKCVEALGDSVEYIYDLTVGIPGIPAGATPQYTYTIASLYVMGLNPGQIHIHIRRFKIADLPKDEDEFATWLYARWQEKDELLDHFYKKGCFPADIDSPPTLINVALRHITEIFQFPLLMSLFSTLTFLGWVLLGL